MTDENTGVSGEVRSTRLKADTEADYIEYKKDRGLTDAEALRRLVREAFSDSVKDKIRLATTFAALLWLVAFATGGSQAGAAVGGAYIAGILIWSSAPPVRETISNMAD
jgi:hypothetical protein